MSTKGIELISKMLAHRLMVVDTIEAPEKFTDEEIGIIKQYNPLDIDYDTKGLPQEAFWSVVTDKITGYGCVIRFGKRYVDIDKKYAWYVFVQGKDENGEYKFEELTQSQDLPMDIESGVLLLKKYLDKYSLNNSYLTESVDNGFKKDITSLYKMVGKSWNFIHEMNQEFNIDEIKKRISDMTNKYPEHVVELSRVEKKLERVKIARLRFEDVYYQLKTELGGFLK